MTGMMVYVLGSGVGLFHPRHVFADSFLKFPEIVLCPTFRRTPALLVPSPGTWRPPLSFRGAFRPIFLPSKVHVLI